MLYMDDILPVLFIYYIQVLLEAINFIMPLPSVMGEVYWFPHRQLIFCFDKRVVYQ